MSARAALLTIALASLAACTPRVNAGSDTTPAVTSSGSTTAAASTAAPTLTSLTPDNASVSSGAVVEILVRGTGFEPGNSPGKNTVEFGPVRVVAVPANAAGTELRFVVPTTYRISEGAPPQRMAPGEYDVVIRTSRGASNALKLRIQ